MAGQQSALLFRFVLPATVLGLFRRWNGQTEPKKVAVGTNRIDWFKSSRLFISLSEFCGFSVNIFIPIKQQWARRAFGLVAPPLPTKKYWQRETMMWWPDTDMCVQVTISTVNRSYLMNKRINMNKYQWINIYILSTNTKGWKYFVEIMLDNRYLVILSTISDNIA